MRKRRLPSAPEETALLREVEGVYEELVNRPIERSCIARTHCCRFKLTGEIPYVTRGEALLAARSWRATGRKSVEESSHSDGRCPFLENVPTTFRDQQASNSRKFNRKFVGN